MSVLRKKIEQQIGLLNSFGTNYHISYVDFININDTTEKNTFLEYEVDFLTVCRDEIIMHKELHMRIDKKIFYLYPFGVDFFLLSTNFLSAENLYENQIQDMRNKLSEIISFMNTLSNDSKRIDLFENIFNSIPLFIAYKDLNYTYQIVTKTVDEFYSENFETIVGKTVFDVYPPSEVEVVLGLDNEAIRLNKPTRQEVEILTDNGFKRIDAFRMPIHNVEGNTTGILSLGLDISDLSKMKKRLENANSIQRNILEIIRAYVNEESPNISQITTYSLELLGKTLLADRAYVFEYNFGKNVMNNTNEWCNEDVNPMIDSLQNISINDFMDVWVSKHLKGENVIIDRVNDLDKESSIFQILNEQDIKSLIALPIYTKGECYGFIGFDSVQSEREWVNEEINLDLIPPILGGLILRNKLEKEIESEIRKTKEASEAKSNFLAIMSHEIRTPISGIINAYHLLEDTKLTEEQRDYLNISQISLDSLNVVVNNVLDYSKIEAKKLESQYFKTDLEDGIKKIIDSLAYLAEEKEIELDFIYDYSIPLYLSIDFQKLKQVLINLISNAIKFTSRGGVKVKVSLLSNENMYCKLNFEIIDTGIGIERINIEKLNRMFYQVDSSLSRSQVGTGIGLSIAYELVDFMGGTLNVESIVGKGSNFHFHLAFHNRYKDELYIEKPGKLLYISLKKDTFDYNSFFNSMNIDVTQSSKLNRINIVNLEDYEYVVINIGTLKTTELLFDIASKLREKNIKFIGICKDRATLKKIRFRKIFDFILKEPISRTDFLKKTTRHKIALEISESSNPQNLLQNNFLIVDDNDINRKVFKLLLEKRGFVVTCAENGFQSITECNKKEFDVIFMDIQMPEMDGYEATKLIRSESKYNSKTPIIAVTANAVKGYIEKAFKVGFNDVLSKPFQLEELHNIISKYVKLENIDKSKSSSIVSSDIMDFNIKQFELNYSSSEIIDEIVETFLSDTIENISLLKKIVKNKDIDKIRERVHYLKTSFAYVSAELMVYLSKQIYDAWVKNDEVQILSLMQCYFEKSDLVIRLVTDYWEERK